jgi:cytochrome c oxidase subunit 2
MLTPSQKLELRLAILVFALLIFFLAMTFYAVRKFGIDLPGCVTNVASFSEAQVIERAPQHFEIHYVARMWSFEPANIELPTGADVDLYLNSIDVNHGFQILGTNVNLMAVPGAVNYAHIKFSKPGKYFVVCHEYCGAGHQNMVTTILVSDHPNAIASLGSKMNADVEAGSKLVIAKSCTACHSIDASTDSSTTGVGPSFKGLWGKTEVLSDGSKILVGKDYIRESIRLPQAKIVQNYQPVMPTLQLSDKEIDQIIEYLISLK